MQNERSRVSITLRYFALIPLIAFGIFSILASGGGGGGGSSAPQPAPPAPPAPTTFTVSGTIFAFPGTATDSDVNDPFAPFASNDTFVTAQAISNPVTLGGYANVAGFGFPGRSTAIGDQTDVYRVSLAANQTITLRIADPIAGDLDLFLFDETGNTLIDGSIGTGDTESLTVLNAGTYNVVVFAFDGAPNFGGASNYVLSIGLTPAAATAGMLRLSDEFMSGEAIVRFKDSVLPASGVDSLTFRAQSVGMLPKGGSPGRSMLLSLGDLSQQGEAFRMLGVKEPIESQRPFSAAYMDPAMRRKWDTLLAIKALRGRTDVKYAEPNYIRHAFATPNDPGYPIQWHYPLINLPQAWDITTGANSVIVAVIDTGVLLSHPDLQGQLVGGFDFISDPARALDGDGIDPNPDDPGDGGSVTPSSFHGTHVAGTVAAATDNARGVAGVTWLAKIMPIRVLGKGGGNSYDIIQGVRFAGGLSNDSGTAPPQRADVINLSLGCRLPPGVICPSSQAEQDVYTAVRNAGVIVIAAAGNDNTNRLSYPASYDGVVSVSAVDINKNKAPYSNFGSAIDVAAPGGDLSKDLNGDGYPDGVLSTWGDDSGGSIQLIYRFYDGTSMATPHIAGVVALMKAVNPGLTPGQFDNLLATGQITEDIGAPGRDDLFGYGLIDAHKAVVAAQGGVPVVSVLTVNPASLNLDSSSTSALLSVQNGGGGVLTVTSVTDDATWLSVAETNVDANKLGAYTATVDRSGLTAGTYEATITFTSTTNTVTVRVIMEVASVAVTGDAGFHYVLLIDPATFTTVAQVNVGVNNGAYSYNFTGVLSGTYEIVAGTDSNNDAFICEPGEACGAYATLDQPTLVTVDRNLTNLDFDTGYVTTVTGQSARNNAQGRLLLPRLKMKRLGR